MTTFDIICLANSFKHGGRCLAGFKTDGSGWIRPVSNKPEGTLFTEHCTLNNQQIPRLFDIIRINYIKSIPEPHHPENWLITNQKWQFMGLPTVDQLNHLLKTEVNQASNSSTLLGNKDDRINWNFLQENPTQKSLCLIRPHNLYWQIETYKTRKYRARFELKNVHYNLGITDPNWIYLLELLPDGIYTSYTLIEKLNLVNFDPNKFLLTISLSEPFSAKNDQHFFCYKLVASVINSQYIKTFLTSQNKNR